MLVWLIQVSIISLVLIYLVHHLFTFFMTTLTVPKVRDVVSGQNEKYGKILDTISSSGNPYLNTDSYTDIGLLPTDQSDQPNQPNQSNQHVPIFQEYGSNSMKNELKSFLKRQMKGAM